MSSRKQWLVWGLVVIATSEMGDTVLFLNGVVFMLTDHPALLDLLLASLLT